MNCSKLVIVSLAGILLNGCSAAKFSSKNGNVLSKSVMGNGDLATNGDSANRYLNQGPGDANSADGSFSQSSHSGNSSPGLINQPTTGNSALGNLPQFPSGNSSPGLINQPTTGNSALGNLPQHTVGNNNANNLSQPIGSMGASNIFTTINDVARTVPIAYICTATFDHVPVSGTLDGSASDKLSLKVNDQLCSASSADIVTGLKGKNLNLKTLCPNVTGKISSVELDVNGKINTILTSAMAPQDFVQAFDTVPNTMGVLYADPHVNAAGCDSVADPLVVHLGHGTPGPLNLSAREQGIWFDIQGLLSGHKKSQISWFTNDEYGLLALPDAKGEIHGIDQLFGDRTFGPDARHPFAADGYAALAKYDANHDRFIDSSDPVFSQLRVWVDRNHNGTAEAFELMTMQEADIAFIDLNFSNQYPEADRYGNITSKKSYIGRTDGTLDLIFDLWFKFVR